MKKTPYTYVVIRYIHDRAAGETLNAGIILYSPENRYLGWQIEHTFGRLHDAFSDFDGEQHRKIIRRLDTSLSLLLPSISNGAMFQAANARELMMSIWTDNGLSNVVSDAFGGLTADLNGTLNDLFYRFVSSQASKLKRPSRSDEEVWQVFKEKLVKTKAAEKLQPATIQTSLFEFKCEHTFKNERLHVVQPVTMDYTNADRNQDRAARWLGTAAALADSDELGTVYLLLGKPQNRNHMNAYAKAKALLDRMAIDHEIVEEDQAAEFAEKLTQTMKQHGLID